MQKGTRALKTRKRSREVREVVVFSRKSIQVKHRSGEHWGALSGGCGGERCFEVCTPPGAFSWPEADIH